ncbi:MAG: tellurite resistance TerB family protein, partial [Vibrio sp.]
MDFGGLLNQVISATGSVDQTRSQSGGLDIGQLGQALGGLLGGSGSAGQSAGGLGGLGDLASMFGGSSNNNAAIGALGASVLSMLLGTSKGQATNQKLSSAGGLAALGGIAMQVFNQWQASTASRPQMNQFMQMPAQKETQVKAETSEQHAMLILKTIIAAAKSDGNVSAEEQEKIQTLVRSMGGSDELIDFVNQQIAQDLNPATLAAEVETQEEAFEVYLTSYMIVEEQ